MGIKESFIIRYPSTAAGKKAWAKQYGMNKYYSCAHWAVRRNDAEFWHALTINALNAAHIRKRPFEKPVVVTYLWDDNLDLDNHAVMGKMILDALKGRLIQDDSRRWVRGVEHYFHDADHIKVILREIGE